jgi:hypothetical protein
MQKCDDCPEAQVVEEPLKPVDASHLPRHEFKGRVMVLAPDPQELSRGWH